MGRVEDIVRGMTVLTFDGSPLGTIIAVEEESFVLRMGWLMRRLFRVRHVDVDHVEGATAFLLEDACLVPLSPEGPKRRSAAARARATSHRAGEASVRREDRERMEDEERPLPPNEGDHPVV